MFKVIKVMHPYQVLVVSKSPRKHYVRVDKEIPKTDFVEIVRMVGPFKTIAEAEQRAEQEQCE